MSPLSSAFHECLCDSYFNSLPPSPPLASPSKQRATSGRSGRGERRGREAEEGKGRGSEMERAGAPRGGRCEQQLAHLQLSTHLSMADSLSCQPGGRAGARAAVRRLLLAAVGPGERKPSTRRSSEVIGEALRRAVGCHLRPGARGRRRGRGGSLSHFPPPPPSPTHTSCSLNPTNTTRLQVPRSRSRCAAWRRSALEPHDPAPRQGQPGGTD